MALYLFFLSSKVGNKVPILMFFFVFIRNKYLYYWITDFIYDSYVFLNLLFIVNIIFFLMRYRSGPESETLNICVCVIVCVWAFGYYNL